MADTFAEQAAALTGRWIDGAMKRAEITQAELAKRTGLEPSTICRLLKGRSMARLDVVLRILQACELEVTQLGVRPRSPASLPGSTVEAVPSGLP